MKDYLFLFVFTQLDRIYALAVAVLHAVNGELYHWTNEYSYAGLALCAEIHDFAKGAVHILYTLQNRN